MFLLKTLFKRFKDCGKTAFGRIVESGEERKMVKGVNKQIVEIVNTENEYFDKAILFVNPEKFESERDELREQADLFVDAYIRKKGLAPRRARACALKNFLKVGGGALGGAVVSALLLLH